MNSSQFSCIASLPSLGLVEVLFLIKPNWLFKKHNPLQKITVAEASILRAPAALQIFVVKAWGFLPNCSHPIGRDIWKKAQAVSKILLQHDVSSGKQWWPMAELQVCTDALEEVLYYNNKLG